MPRIKQRRTMHPERRRACKTMRDTLSVCSKSFRPRSCWSTTGPMVGPLWRISCIFQCQKKSFQKWMRWKYILTSEAKSWMRWEWTDERKRINQLLVRAILTHESSRKSEIRGGFHLNHGAYPTVIVFSCYCCAWGLAPPSCGAS